MRSAAPVLFLLLFLSGALDLMGPPEWADPACTFLPESWHLIAPGAGHCDVTACTRTLIGRFVERGGAVTLDTPGARSRGTGALLANARARR